MTTRKLGFKALLEAVYDRWGNHALTSSYRIYNIGNVPDAPTWPYVAFGSPFGRESTRFKTRDTEGEENGFITDVWSDYRGDKEVMEMMNNLIQALTSSKLSISGYKEVIVFLDHADVLDDSTEAGRPAKHGVLRFLYEMTPT